MRSLRRAIAKLVYPEVFNGLQQASQALSSVQRDGKVYPIPRTTFQLLTDASPTAYADSVRYVKMIGEATGVGAEVWKHDFYTTKKKHRLAVWFRLNP